MKFSLLPVELGRRLQPLGDTRAETPVDLPALVCANTLAWGGCSPDILGGTLCVLGAAETPATWVIPGGDSAPTKMITHLPILWREAEHHRNLWSGTLFLSQGRKLRSFPGRNLRTYHSSTMFIASGDEQN